MQVKIAKLESDVDNIKNHISDIRTDLREMRYDIDKLNINLRLEMKTDFRLMFAALTPGWPPLSYRDATVRGQKGLSG